ncbi:SusE domain-containing protein [Seonamhaeicola maritimus]|uniref:SusF/SusE family outer membrane protein n=1 Tax=Seonamhaeicola maritimus TaxID=2591822 RepID=A0A5C7GH76_9FLAO|nr:SusE domain-containing protein [Seonamhaeicola maritimus]TXG36651.1 SusF/SusE family outer membrane protein [Seonamhaeicola maritimus]
MMKNFKNISSIIGLVMLFFATSCDDTTDKFYISDPTAPVLTNLSFSQLELDALNTSNPAVTLSWSESDYGQQTAVNYAVEFASDEAFTESYTAATVTGRNTITFSISEINATAGNTGLNPFEWATLYTRVVASLGTQQGKPIASNTLNFDVYPYFNYSFEDYYLVGSATARGWNNNDNNPPLFRDESNSQIFYYTGYFDKAGSDAGDGRFKVLETKGLWQPQWGTSYPDLDDTDPVEASGGIASNPPGIPNPSDPDDMRDPGRFGVTDSGYFTFTINFASKTFSVESFDESGITSPTSLEIQGSSVETTTMTALTFDGHIWYATGVHLVPGELAFIADGNAWGSTTSFSGVATDGGGSIPVIVEDDYDIWFNDLTGRYIMVPLNL